MNISGWDHLDPNVKNLWRIGSLISSLIIGALPVFPILILQSNSPTRFATWMWAIPPAVFVIYLILGQIFVGRAFDCYRYRLGEDDIAVAKGIFWKSWRFVNRNRVQHVDLHAGPIARALGLVQINIYVGGMPEAAASIPGLSVARGEELRSRLIKADIERPVVSPISEPPLG